MLDGLLPLLQAVEPQDLATTLGALSQALEGRGEHARRHAGAAAGAESAGCNPALPDLQEDITQLADFADNLAEAAPDLLDALADFTVTSRTVVEQRAELRELLTARDRRRPTTCGPSSTANGENIIALADASRPTLETLARYSPEFPCLLDQLAGLVDRRSTSVREPAPTSRACTSRSRSTPDQGKYVPNADEPRYLDDRGPRCYPIVIPRPAVPAGRPVQGRLDGTRRPSGPASRDRPRRDPGVVRRHGPGQLAGRAADRRRAARGPATAASPERCRRGARMLVGPLYRGDRGDGARDADPVRPAGQVPGAYRGRRAGHHGARADHRQRLGGARTTYTARFTDVSGLLRGRRRPDRRGRSSASVDDVRHRRPAVRRGASSAWRRTSSCPPR